MEFSFDAKLPEDYINEVSLRMEIYHRLGEAATFKDVEDLLAEIKDRFGEPPEQVIWLYHLTRIRVFAAFNHFNLLKFNTLSFLAEQQKGKLITKLTLLLPKKVQKPKELEEHVIEQLKKNFPCTPLVL
jgi:transcription-repair coupling factor (superfamily II helicase)